MVKQTFLISEDAGRIDAYLAEQLEVSRSFAAGLIADGSVLVNGKVLQKSKKLNAGDTIEVTVPDPVLPKAEPENIPLDIVYEDDDVLVVNKPQGMVVHPAPGNYTGTLVNALLYHCKGRLSGINGVLRPGIVHRIDKDTSGLLMVAKNDFAHNALAEQIKNHSFDREYETVVFGQMPQPQGDIELPIGRHPVKRKQMAVTDQNSKPAKTHYEVLATNGSFSHLRVKLYTGRTHQIRVHLSYLGHPVVGDPLYGGGHKTFQLKGQCLHAKKLGFVHPTTGEYLSFESELPEYFCNFLREIELYGEI